MNSHSDGKKEKRSALKCILLKGVGAPCSRSKRLRNVCIEVFTGVKCGVFLHPKGTKQNLFVQMINYVQSRMCQPVIYVVPEGGNANYWFIPFN